MARTKDLTGQRFGKLTVLERLPECQDRYWLWRCRCDCGGEILVNTKRLTRGTVTNCGCVPKQTAQNGTIAEDLTGRRFGRLTALRRTESKNGRTRWICLCDCGREHTASAHELKAGKVTSCGCRRRLNRNSITNIAGQRFGRLVALCPTAKRDKKGSVDWFCLCDCGTEMEVTEDALVHGNYRSCGCRKQELQQDITNRLHRIDGTCIEWLEKRKHRSDNTSGFRGVYHMRDGKYRAAIGFKRHRFHIGTYPTFEEAVAARLEAEKQIHDAFVKAYYLWEEQSAASPEPIPFIFEAEKVDGRFQITTNIKP